MRVATLLLVAVAVIIGAFWAWLGAAVPMPDNPVGRGEKLYCVSYAPFRGWQSPFDPNTRVTAAQIDDDLARLSKISDCVRTYSIDEGIDQVPAIAARHGMKVILGLWLSGKPDKNKYEVETTIKIANENPGTVQAVVVGNEVLLRGELSAPDLANIIRSVKARVSVPVTYADVWEFWLRNPSLADAVDFITIHILPYWEDFPVPASKAADHVDAIRTRVAKAFPGKDILIGEVGWPSAGRMREGALPSPVNQAKVLQDVLIRAKRSHYNVNLIEAFDQPWKRLLEGTVGGHWGLLDSTTREFKFTWGEPVSSHPYWRWQAAGGIVFAALIFLAAALTRRKTGTVSTWVGVAIIAVGGGATIGWTIENIPLESLGVGGWVRSLAQAVVAIAAPLLAAWALRAEISMPRFSSILAECALLRTRPLAFALGFVLIATTVLAAIAAVGLTFDPRYKDFPFAPLTGAVAPVFVLSLFGPRGAGVRGAAEIAAAAVLAVCAVYVVFNESFANWQSLWFCATLAALALTLVRVRGERS
ncbi:MAG: putative beta (1-6) glucans synthase [Pseudolabrys sp.]|jgi:glucan 1,3-beta-glucosidase|nr:putative beta (1-6) glucans synthase [Pseudolabrys sp.]